MMLGLWIFLLFVSYGMAEDGPCGIKECAPDGERQGDPENENNYYWCLGGSWSKQQCPGDFCFCVNEDLCADCGCDVQESCPTTPEPEPTTTEAPEPPTTEDPGDQGPCGVKQCDNIGDMQGDPKNFNNYYWCLADGWTLQQCPGEFCFCVNHGFCGNCTHSDGGCDQQDDCPTIPPPTPEPTTEEPAPEPTTEAPAPGTTQDPGDPADLQVVLCASVKDEVLHAANKEVIRYDTILADKGDAWDAETSTFLVDPSKAGIYYVSMSVGIPRNRSLHSSALYFTDESEFQTGQRRLSYSNSFGQNENYTDYAMRGFLQYLNATNAVRGLQVKMEPNSAISGEPFYGTKLTVFRYADHSAITVAFSAALDTDFTEANEAISWNVMLLNVGPFDPPFDQSRGVFTADIDGYYFFHFSAAPMAQSNLWMVLYKRDNAVPPSVTRLPSLTRTNQVSDGIMMCSRSVLLHLKAGDEVVLGNDFDSRIFSSIALETGFQGFLLSLETPLVETAEGAFSYMEDWSYDGNDPLILSDWKEHVNFGLFGPPFDAGTGMYHVGLPGFYFISFSVGTMPNKQVIVRARQYKAVDGSVETIAFLHRTKTYPVGHDLLSHETIVEASDGDMIFLEADGGRGIMSTFQNMETAFLVMRLRNFSEDAIPPQLQPI